MADTLGPTKPYMVRAIHEWCVDNALTPHLLVVVNAQTKVPKAFIKNGEIVLNLNYSATKDLHIDNDAVVFSARFGGVAQNLYVPMDAVRGIFAKENGQGMFFELESPVATVSDENEAETVEVKKQAKQEVGKKRPSLTIVK
jgi:stringent starvation protein B